MNENEPNSGAPETHQAEVFDEELGPHSEPVATLDASSSTEQVAIDKDEATRAIGWTMVFAVITKLCFPLIGIYIARALGPIQLGMFYVLNNIVQFSEVLRDAGLQQTFLAESGMDEKKEASYHFVAMVAGIIPMAILSAAAPWVAATMKVPEYVWALPLVSLVCLINGFATVPRAKMLRAGRIKRQGAYDLIGATIGLTTAVSLVFAGAGFVALIAQMLIASLWAMGIATYQFRVRSIHFSTDAFRTVGKKSLAILGANGINNLFLFGDQFVIGKVLGSQASGYYGAAMNLAMKPAELFAFPMTRTLMVAFSQSSVDKERLNRIFGRAIVAAILAVLPIYAFLAIFSSPIIEILLGPKFAISASLLTLLSLYLSCRVLGNISGHALVPAGKHFLTLYPWIGCIVVTSGMLMWAAPRHDVWSFAIAFAVGAVFVYVSLLIIAIRYCAPPKTERSRIFRAALVLIFSAAVMIGLRFLPIDPKIGLGLAILLGPFVHLGLIGTFIAGQTLKYLNPRGLKQLWNDL